MRVTWPDTIDEILDGDLVVMLAYVTPAKGTVLLPVTNFALRDRERGTVTVLSSLGAWKKLDRIRRNPNVALAFHTRRHGFSDRPEYVLVQGRASFSWEPDHAWLESIGETWERFMGPRDLGPLWDRWLRVYHWERVGVEIAVERIIVRPDLSCRGRPEVLGAPLPQDPPPPQRPPARGTGPRMSHRRAAAWARRLPYTLLGWVGADGRPIVVSVEIESTEQSGIALNAPTDLVPPGGRRAGLTAHWFTPGCVGQHQRVHTGWLEPSPGGKPVYAPHTRAAYLLPPSKTVYRTVVGLFTRLRYREARRKGVFENDDGRPGGRPSRQSNSD